MVTAITDTADKTILTFFVQFRSLLRKENRCTKQTVYKISYLGEDISIFSSSIDTVLLKK